MGMENEAKPTQTFFAISIPQILTVNSSPVVTDCTQNTMHTPSVILTAKATCLLTLCAHSHSRTGTDEMSFGNFQ